MGFFAVFVYGFECMKAGLNAGKRGIVFQTRENTHGAQKTLDSPALAVIGHKTLLWRAPPERSYFRVRSYRRS